MSVMAPYHSEQRVRRDGFGQLLRAEWTKFRTVRGWVIGLLVAVLLIVGLGAFTGANSQCSVADVTPQNPNPPWVEYRPVRDVTRTVMLPSPASGWRTK